MKKEKDIPVKLALNPHMAEAAKGYSELRGLRSFAKAFNQFYEFGDRGGRLFGMLAPQVRTMSRPDDMARPETTEDMVKRNVVDILWQIGGIEWVFNSEPRYATIYFSESQYARLKAKAKKENMTLTACVAIRGYYGLGLWNKRESLKAEIARILEDEDALGDPDVRLELTKHQGTLNFLNEHIFSLAGAERQDAYEVAIARFLADLKETAVKEENGPEALSASSPKRKPPGKGVPSL